MTEAEKKDIIKEFATHEGDTGSSEVQIAVLTKRINDLNEHMKKNPKIIIQREDFLRWLAAEEIYFLMCRIKMSMLIENLLLSSVSENSR